MKSNKRAVGTSGEQLAAKLLSLNGYRIAEMNFRVKSGEIDVIAYDKEYLCFIEVKARKTSGSGYPEEAVGIAKQRKIRNTALFYISSHKIPETTPMRFDVILILGDKYRIIRNAFDFG